MPSGNKRQSDQPTSCHDFRRLKTDIYWENLVLNSVTLPECPVTSVCQILLQIRGCHTKCLESKTTNQILYPFSPQSVPTNKVFMYVLALNMQNPTCNCTSTVTQMIFECAMCPCICPVLSVRPEKTLPPDLTGTARMKQHERWSGMLPEKAGVQQRWQRAGLEMWRGSPFVGEVDSH